MRSPWGTSSGRLPDLEWAAAFRPLTGESVSGDHHIVAPFEGGILLAVVDALGHGSEAEFAARLAAATLSSRRDSPLNELLKEVHQNLSKTRGVAAAVASIDFQKGVLTWISVGNVEGVLVRVDPKVKRQSIIQHGGIVGYQLPRLPPVENIALHPGDRLCFATDGIKNGFAESVNLKDTVEKIAAQVLVKFEDVRDDALVLVAEYVGAGK
jgi:negative regulator of sigma-B (phosphoserine phosphatase)